MTYTTKRQKFIDANIFLLRWESRQVEQFIDSLKGDEHCTSVLVLTEVYHKLRQKNVSAQTAFSYIRGIMGTIKILDFTQEDLFDALRNQLEINVNDKVHISVMKNNGIGTIISYDKDFDRDKTTRREEL